MRALLLLLVLGGLGYGGVQVLSQLQQAPAAKVTDGLAPVAVSAGAAASFDQKLAALERAAADARRTGRAAPLEVVFTAEELTSKLAELGGANVGGIAATGTKVHFSGGNVIATSRLMVQGLGVDVGIVAKPVVEAGQAKLVIEDIQTGGVALPDALKQQLRAQLGQAIDPRALGVPFDVTGVQVQDGRVVITGTARP